MLENLASSAKAMQQPAAVKVFRDGRAITANNEPMAMKTVAAEAMSVVARPA